MDRVKLISASVKREKLAGSVFVAELLNAKVRLVTPSTVPSELSSQR